MQRFPDGQGYSSAPPGTSSARLREASRRAPGRLADSTYAAAMQGSEGSVADPEAPSAASVTSPARPRRADIQGLRAVAVIAVVAFHAGLPVSGGFVGVDVFFVISGFVIGGLLFDELDRTGRVDVGNFLARRVRRILPALALVIVVTL